VTARPDIYRVLGLCLAVAYAAIIVWVYARQPQTLPQLAGGLADAVGAYRVDAARFERGVSLFHEGRFPESRAAFASADPARRDAVTQFYVAYSFYRQGWGRLYHDDALFAEGLAAVTRAAALADGGLVVVDDPNLGLQTSDELRAELEEGLTRDLADLNPLRSFRPRK